MAIFIGSNDAIIAHGVDVTERIAAGKTIDARTTGAVFKASAARQDGQHTGRDE
ncbi:hypothetical protein L1D34_21990 [Vibrio mediterranei]|uniref:hypothetical protein n=1 Tax=Vibrio mediterranei TaxID=689 RepID=UPI001EFC41A9|nr:hypothetical protein [Vibrio mediterranei]MCG9627509.1 hypothetical protein [Vibrio mediterranei]